MALVTTPTPPLAPTISRAETAGLAGPGVLGTTAPAPFRAAGRFLLVWAAGWAALGCSVALGIAFTRGPGDLPPLLVISVLFAEVVGFTALTSARVVFPVYARLPYSARAALQVLTLFSGTVFGSVAILATQPYLALARPKTVAMVILVNAAFAVVVGIALHTYDTLRRQLEESFRRLREKEALERDLEIAREVQRELLPRQAPDIRGLELAGICLPAVGVGGDYFDYLPFAEDRLGIVIADVSGKGIPAALLMAGLQASVRTLALPSLPPGEVNRRLNELLLRSTSTSRYATLFLGFFDARRRILTYSNAGHYPPLHLGALGAHRLSAGGRPLGLLEDSLYGEGAREVAPGDFLVLYTDGVVESPGAGGEEFGEARLVSIVERHRGRPLDAILAVVLEELARWRGGGPPHDDVTLVLARGA